MSVRPDSAEIQAVLAVQQADAELKEKLAVLAGASDETAELTIALWPFGTRAWLETYGLVVPDDENGLSLTEAGRVAIVLAEAGTSEPLEEPLEEDILDVAL